MAGIPKWKIMRIISFFLLFIFIILLVLGIIRNEIEIYLLLIIPVLKINGIVGPMAVLALFSGIILLFLSLTLGRLPSVEENKGSDAPKKDQTDIGGVVFIGPIPIIFGNRSFRDKFPSWWKLLVLGIISTIIVYIIVVITITFLL